MRYVLLLLLIPLFSFSQNVKQDTSDFFFQIAYDSSGLCYGKSLIPPEYDTIEKEYIVRHETSKLDLIEEIIWDTIKTDNYFIPAFDENVNQLLPFADTVHQLILVTEEDRRLSGLPPDSMLYATVTEQVMTCPPHHFWSSKVEDNSKSINWEKRNKEANYGVITKRVIAGLWHLREISIPAEYITIAIVKPHASITIRQKELIDLLCSKSYQVKSVYRTTKEKVVPEVTGTYQGIEIRKKAGVELQEIYCNPTKELIANLQSQLYYLDLYEGNFYGDLNLETKKAIVDYQVKNNLPVGQLDKDTVKCILNEKI